MTSLDLRQVATSRILNLAQLTKLSCRQSENVAFGMPTIQTFVSWVLKALQVWLQAQRVRLGRNASVAFVGAAKLT